ncbi:hypothetical protein KIL84_003593 [Mauremys mutica]|uniref:Uncharacterized protein n=1 Tax=Mauremys mutica TaxID=74926 RepID=A0A9D3WW68_9SAUR|nr:hypothetical protein KIL84_003593 [Mauremys mutica]
MNLCRRYSPPHTNTCPPLGYNGRGGGSPIYSRGSPMQRTSSAEIQAVPQAWIKVSSWCIWKAKSFYSEFQVSLPNVSPRGNESGSSVQTPLPLVVTLTNQKPTRI